MAGTSILSPELWGTTRHRTTKPSRTSSIMLISLFFLLQLAGFARAGVVFTNDEYVLRPNEPFTINWEGNRGPVTLTLMNGPDIDLQVVMVIASGLSGNKYTWTPPQTLKTDGYELQIEDGVSTDYSSRFQYPAPPEQSTSITLQPTSQSRPSQTPTTFSTSTAPPTSNTDSSSASSPSTTATSEGLSTGATAGIAAGASIAGIAILALLGWLIYRRGKKAGAKSAINQNMSQGPVGGYYAPSGTDNFDQETTVGGGGSSVAPSGGYKPSNSPWSRTTAPRSNTPFAELGQPEYTPREMWAGGIYQGQPPTAQHQVQDSTKGVVNVQERSYTVPLPSPGQAPGYDSAYNQEQDPIQQQQRIQDDWHAVVSPASRTGTGLVNNGGFDFGASPSSVTSSPPMGYSATVTAGAGPGPSTPPPPPGLSGEGGGSPLSFSSRKYASRIQADEGPGGLGAAGGIYQGPGTGTGSGGRVYGRSEY